MKEIAIILLSVIFVNNFVLAKFLGICPFLGVSKSINSAIGMSLAVIFVMGMASAATWPIYQYILVPMGLQYFQTIVFILVIATLVQLVETILKKYVPSLHRALGVYLPLITTNCAVLGVTILNITNNFDFVQSVVNGVGGGIGFMLAIVIFAGVRLRIEHNDIPECFKGFPIALISASIVSLSFLGFTGVVEGIFK